MDNFKSWSVLYSKVETDQTFTLVEETVQALNLIIDGSVARFMVKDDKGSAVVSRVITNVHEVNLV